MLAWNPEFLREGHAVEDTMRPDRLVYGLPPDTEQATYARALLDGVYAATVAEGTPVITSDYPTAELVKTAANAFLATKISFINAMAEVCEAAGADVTVLAEAIGHDERIGPKFLGAGLGFGGGCLPKDIRAFMARAGELGADQALTFLREVDAINMRRRIRMVELAREVVGGSFLGRRVAVLGAAFKPDSDDIRDSPALNVAAQIQLQGASVVVTDPAAVPNVRLAWPQLPCADVGHRGRDRCGRRPAAHRMARVSRARPGGARHHRPHPADPGRPQRARPGTLAGRRLDLPRPGPSPRLTRDAPHPPGRDTFSTTRERVVEKVSTCGPARLPARLALVSHGRSELTRCQAAHALATMSSRPWRICQPRSRAASSPVATIRAGSPGRRSCRSAAELDPGDPQHGVHDLQHGDPVAAA